MKNTIYMAPMEGLTDFTFRNAYEKILAKDRLNTINIILLKFIWKRENCKIFHTFYFAE